MWSLAAQALRFVLSYQVTASKVGVPKCIGFS
jgi:hypothetical protein